MDGKRDRTTYVKSVKLKEIAELEPAKKGEVYKKGTILFWTQAGRGHNVEYLEEDGEISERYAVATVHDEHNPKYIFYAIERIYMRWVHNTMQNINLPWKFINDLRFDIHVDRTIQDKIVEDQERIERMIKAIEREIELEQELKKTMLRKMFP